MVMKSALLFLFIFLSIPIVAAAITLEELLEKARTTHPLVRSQRLASEIAAEQREGLKGSQDWLLDLGGSAIYDEPIPSPVPGSSSRNRILGVNARVTRSDWNSGSRVSIAYGTGWGDANIIGFGGSRFSQFQNTMSAEYSLSLLRNAGGILQRLEYDLAEHDIDISRLEADEIIENFLLNLGSKFLNWSFQQEQLQILEDRLNIAQEDLEQSRQKRADNLIEEVDLLRSEDAERIALQNLLLTQSEWKASRIEIATLLDDPSILIASPEFDLFSQAAGLSQEIVRLRLSEHSRAIEILNVAKEQLGVGRTGFENALKSDLSFVVSGALRNGDPAFNDSLAMDRPEVTVGLQFSKPIGNTTAESDLRRVDLQIRQVVNQIRSLELDLASNAMSIITQMTELEQILALNRDQITSAKRRTEEEIKLYNQGRGELNFVHQSQDNEATSRLIHARNATLYQQLFLQLKALMDELHHS